jgi:integrase
VPLQAIALAALDQLEADRESQLVFPVAPRRLLRPPQLPQPLLETRPNRGGHRAAASRTISATWAQLGELAARLGPRHGPPVTFAAATGLRPGEWMALEQRDIDRQARVVTFATFAPRAASQPSTSRAT